MRFTCFLTQRPDFVGELPSKIGGQVFVRFAAVAAPPVVNFWGSLLPPHSLKIIHIRGVDEATEHAGHVWAKIAEKSGKIWPRTSQGEGE
jgi:hypothetical protein